jgi:putative ABC transport system permease protein
MNSTLSEIIAITVAVLVIGVAAALVTLAVQSLRRPVLAKIGLRNIARRPTQSVLIVVGLTLSTVIIISSLSIGDTLNYSVRRETVAAYGKVDEIIAPPLISSFAGFGRGDPAAQQQVIQDLTAGGLTTLLTVVQGGLPGISTTQYSKLKAAAQNEPLIDGMAGSILFPTIIRNTTTGQGVPIGFLFAVDQDYDTQFGVTTIDGQSVKMAALSPGVGNVFIAASDVFSVGQRLVGSAGISSTVGTAVIAAAAGIGAVLTGATDVDFATLSLDVTTLKQLGIDTGPLEQRGVQTVTLASLGLTPVRLRALGVTTDTLKASTLLSNTLGIDPAQVAQLPNRLLSAVNVNTLGSEADRVLGQYGLQLRQGDIYLNRLGAQNLDAHVGDVLELYIGPLPVPYRVKAIVSEAGPLSAVLPVAMMRLDEAQKLLFMQGKINNVLVSNKGDELGGVQYTDEVSQKLRVLAMDEVALNDVIALLRRPDIRAAVTATANRAPRQPFRNQNVPPLMRSIINSIIPPDTSLTQVKALNDVLDQPGISPEVRNLMGDLNLRTGLRRLNLPEATRTELDNALNHLNYFDLVDQLSKATVLTISDIAGGVFSQIFSLFGMFSILSGILLIFLIFVMLATERRSEMGIARAIGVQRSHLVQMFVTEGMVYDLAAAALGVVLGLFVSYAMIGFLGNLFSNVTAQLGASAGTFQFHFQVAPVSIVAGYCLGVLLTYIVVTVASWRVSRLNIVAAIRDLPEEASARPRSTFNKVWRSAFGPILIALAIALMLNGTYTTILLGVSLLLWGIATLALRILERTSIRPDTLGRIVYTTLGLGVLLVWAVPWNTVTGSTTRDILQQDQLLAILPFVLRGPMIILGAILAIMFNAEAISWLVSRVLGGIPSIAPILKTAIAYPLNARFRTGMAMVMFSIVISTVTIMAMVIQATQSLIVMSDKVSAGFEISTSNTLLSVFSPLQNMEADIPNLKAAYPRLADIDVIGSVASTNAQWNEVGHSNIIFSGQLVGVNDAYLTQAAQVYPFKLRAPGYDSDAAVWKALQERDDVAIVTPRFGLATVTTAATTLTETFIDISIPRASNALLAPNRLDKMSEPRRFQVIGMLAENGTRAGGLAQINRAALTKLAGMPVAPAAYYIKVRQGAEVHAVKQEIERAFVANGISVTVMAESFALGQSVTRGVLSLFQGFMALGLLVGIAALGVISSRSVVERRQQIGVLRAIGFQPRMVALSLVLEASFISLTGLLIGALTGILLGDSIVRSFFTQLTPQTLFPVPWLQIGTILLISYGFALLTTIIPAYQAAHIVPAEALRYE